MEKIIIANNKETRKQKAGKNRETAGSPLIKGGKFQRGRRFPAILLRSSRAAPNRQAVAKNCAAVTEARLLDYDNIRMGKAISVKRGNLQGGRGGKAICKGAQRKLSLFFITPDAAMNFYKAILAIGNRDFSFR